MFLDELLKLRNELLKDLNDDFTELFDDQTTQLVGRASLLAQTAWNEVITAQDNVLPVTLANLSDDAEKNILSELRKIKDEIIKRADAKLSDTESIDSTHARRLNTVLKDPALKIENDTDHSHSNGTAHDSFESSSTVSPDSAKSATPPPPAKNSEVSIQDRFSPLSEEDLIQILHELVTENKGLPKWLADELYSTETLEPEQGSSSDQQPSNAPEIKFQYRGIFDLIKLGSTLPELPTKDWSQEQATNSLKEALQKIPAAIKAINDHIDKYDIALKTSAQFFKEVLYKAYTKSLAQRSLQEQALVDMVTADTYPHLDFLLKSPKLVGNKKFTLLWSERGELTRLYLALIANDHDEIISLESTSYAQATGKKLFSWVFVHSDTWYGLNGALCKK